MKKVFVIVCLLGCLVGCGNNSNKGTNSNSNIDSNSNSNKETNSNLNIDSNSNSNEGTNSNSNKNTNNSSSNITQNKVSYAGTYKATVSISEEDTSLKAIWELKINNDNSCSLSRNVTGGSGWIYEGTCTYSDKEIILQAIKHNFDAEENKINEKHKFTIKSNNTISYIDSFNKEIILKKQ